MLGIITWIIGKNGDGQKYIEEVSIDKISEQSRVEYLCNLFNNLSLDESTPIGECKAWLHIQDGADLFCASPIGEPISKDNNFAFLPEKISFSQDKLISRKDSYKEEKDKEKKDDPILPILHISTLNLLKKEAPFKGIPRYVKIMDSSIWNLYFNIEDYYNGIDIRSWIIENIANNTQKGIYNLSIAQEYADLNARLAKQSFIYDFMGHGQFVSPFVFHSEQEMRQQLLDKKDQLKKIQSHSWRILLVDDKWNEELSTAENVNNKKAINKYTIIKSRLEELGFSVINRDLKQKVENNSPVVYFDCATNVDDAINRKLPNQKYDIILLDYLLDVESKSKSVEYGYEVLKQLKEADSAQRENAPQKRNFFMFISAFTTAVDERLHAEDITRSEDYWYIGEGACPTNTPEQFKLYLINLMWRRLDDSGINDLTASHIYKLLHKIFIPKEEIIENGTSVRKRANEHYREILSLQYHYLRLLKDVEMEGDKPISETTGSVLVTEFISRQTNLGGLLEHLVQLVHITAFGTVRQWPELWEEYIFCKAQFDDVFDEELKRINSNENAEEQLKQFIKECSERKEEYEKTEGNSYEWVLKLKHKLYQDIEKHILNLRAL